LIIWLAVLLALLLGACGGAASPAPSSPAAGAKPASGLTKVVAGFPSVSATNITVWVAKEAGLFEKSGLDVSSAR